MNDLQFDFFVCGLKQVNRMTATSKAQYDEIDRQIEIASHKTKSAAAAYNGDWQKAFLELLIANNRQHY